MLATLTRLFPLWALLLSVIAYYTPTTFTPVGPFVPSLLMLIMFGMGVHLKVDDFKRVLTSSTRRGGYFPALSGDAARRMDFSAGI